jgi:hypothetical protein
MNFFYWIMCFLWSNEKKKRKKKKVIKVKLSYTQLHKPLNPDGDIVGFQMSL